MGCLSLKSCNQKQIHLQLKEDRVLKRCCMVSPAPVLQGRECHLSLVTCGSLQSDPEGVSLVNPVVYCLGWLVACLAHSPDLHTILQPQGTMLGSPTAALSWSLQA